MDLNFEKILQENHGKEIAIYTNNDHHYQGQLVGCQCRKNMYECSHLIMLLMGVNYVDIPVEDIVAVKSASEILH
jgi:hypothetical protein